MESRGSVSCWLNELRTGNELAAQQLWEKYFTSMVGLCRRRLRGFARRCADEEDAALSAFDSFCRGVERGRFPNLQDRGDLWQLLVVIAARKTCDYVQRERRLKRGGGHVGGESWFPRGIDSEQSPRAIEQIIGEEPTPALAATVAEEFERLLGLLGDESLRKTAQMKLEGFENQEIADQLGCSRRSVERKLWVIRAKWSDEAGPDE